ncbi:energy transducer TonB [bacterium]|nr:energy transducer TonB [bacterium]
MRKLLSLVFSIAILSSYAQDTIATSEQVDNLIYHIVQENPVFPGGTDSLIAHINREMKYPDEAIASEEQGMVFVQFIVNKDGCVDTNDVTILRGAATSLNQEAIRLVKLFPCWTPGRQNGLPVRVYYKMPIRFQLNE